MYATPSDPYAADAAGGDDAMARHDDREPVRGAERAGGALRVRVAGERRELAVGHDLAARNARRRSAERELERRRAVEVELDVGEVVLRAPDEVRAQPLDELRCETVTVQRSRYARVGGGSPLPGGGTDASARPLVEPRSSSRAPAQLPSTAS